MNTSNRRSDETLAARTGMVLPVSGSRYTSRRYPSRGMISSPNEGRTASVSAKAPYCPTFR